MIRGVVFDMDGLMFNTERIGVDGWLRAGEVLGYEIPESLIIETLGVNFLDTRRIIEAGLPASFPYDRAFSMHLDYLDAYFAEKGAPIKPGLLPLLDFLEARGIKRAIASSSPRARVVAYLENAGLSRRFDALVCGDMIERGKPAPDIYLRACAELSLPPASCVALEDAPAGIRSAAEAGMTPVMIPDLVAPDAFSIENARAILPDLDAARIYLSDALRRVAQAPN